MAVRSNAMRGSKNSDQAQVVLLLRLVLDDVLSDRRFFLKKSISAIELAEHILSQAAGGERDITRLKEAAFKKLGFAAFENDPDAGSRTTDEQAPKLATRATGQ